jgi:acyl-CoA hydrolase
MMKSTGKSIRERALALIDVAHPNCREELLAAAKRLGYVRPEQYLASQAAYPVHESARSSSRTAPRS